MWQQWVNFFVGIWLVISAFVPKLLTLGNIVTSGTIVLILAIWGALEAKKK